jgi:hypothetical protein
MRHTNTVLQNKLALFAIRTFYDPTLKGFIDWNYSIHSVLRTFFSQTPIYLCYFKAESCINAIQPGWTQWAQALWPN